MEKRKSAAGQLTMLLYSDDRDHVVASVGIFIMEGYTRLKNVLVDHNRHGQGFATRMIAEISRQPEYSGFPMIAYQLPRSVGRSLYSRMSFRHVTSCFEWKKERTL
jgi:hypothetical protein